MKDKKRRIEPFIFYNHTGIERHFEKMAEKGWMIESLSNYFWTYRRIEPCKIKFTVTYYANSSEFDPFPSEEQQVFLDMCEHTGWKLAASWFQMKIFYNEGESPIPIQTDPVSEIETIHAACKKNFLRSYFVFLIISLLLGGSFVLSLFNGSDIRSNNSALFQGFTWIMLFILSSVELVTYFTWLRKAKKAAEEGKFLETPNTVKFQTSLLIILFVGIAVWLLGVMLDGNTILISATLAVLIVYVIIVILINGVKNLLKRANVPAKLNVVIIIICCFVLSFLLIGLVTHVLIGAFR